MANKLMKPLVPKVASGTKKVMKPLGGKLPATKVSAGTSTGSGRRIVN